MSRRKIALHWVVGVLLCALLVMVAVPALSSPSQQANRQLIESDAVAVVREGTWESQVAAGASGGAYMYNTPSLNPSSSQWDGKPSTATLSLAFSGTTIEVWYVAGPGLGTLAIEVDGIVLRTVITTSDQTAYQQQAVIDYLSDETHTLRVYAQAGGVVGIDAFVATFTWTENADIGTANSITRLPCDAETPIEQVSLNPSELTLQSVSSDGRYVVFMTGYALVPNDTNSDADIYMFDRQTDTYARVSVGSGGTQASGRNGTISGDGRFVSFATVFAIAANDNNNNTFDLYVYDRQTSQTELISVAYDGSVGNQSSLPASSTSGASFSTDGRFIAFESYASNLVMGDTNGVRDVFVRDRQLNQTIRVSVSSNGDQAVAMSGRPQVSGNGRFVAFYSSAENLVPNDTNGITDIFVHDLQTHETTRVSVSTTGTQSDDISGIPAISFDGRYIAFYSGGTNLVAGDTNGWSDVFLHDRQTGQTSRVSVSSTGEQSDGSSGGPVISSDGRYIAFISWGTNLAGPDTDQGAYDEFVYDRLTRHTGRLSEAFGGDEQYGDVWASAISGDGQYVVFRSYQTNLVCNLIGGGDEVFIVPTVAGFKPTNLTASGTSGLGIGLTWTDNTDNEAQFRVQRSDNGVDGWATIGLVNANSTSFKDYTAHCGQTYHYRVAAVRNNMAGFYSIPANAAATCATTDQLVLFRTDYAAISLIASLTDLPPLAAYNSFNLNAPANGQFVMGDWNGDGLKTPGVYAASGVFYYTNTLGPTTTWSAIWIGLLGRPVMAGRFNGGVGHDCIGAVDSGNFPPYGKAFALYFTCDLTPATAPPLTFQWLSVVLPDNQGYTGTHQFAAGDWNGDGVDSVAIRRGAFIAFTDVAPTTLLSQFNRAQYWGIPPVTGGNEGVFLVGNWNLDSTDSFGVFYANGNFYRRDDLDWNSGVYILQRVGQPIGTPVIATSWRQQ